MRVERLAPAARAPAVTSTSLRLLSWNLHGPPLAPRRRERMRAAAGRLREESPDLLVLQEVWLREDERQLTRALDADFAPLPMPAGGWPLRRSGLLSYRRRLSAWEVSALRLHSFQRAAPAWRIWEGDGLGRKGVLEIRIRNADAEVAVLGAHLQASYVGNEHTAVRAAQLQQLEALATRLSQEVPVIVAGDLNTQPHEPIFAHLAGGTDLTRPLRAAGKRDTHLGGDGTHGGWLDYIIGYPHRDWRVGAEDLRLIENEAPDHPYSDHHAVAAHIRLRPA